VSIINEYSKYVWKELHDLIFASFSVCMYVEYGLLSVLCMYEKHKLREDCDVNNVRRFLLP
jgi:hypothetical protein